MKKCANLRIGLYCLAGLAAACVLPAVILAADHAAKAPAKTAEAVEMFAGIAGGQIEVKLVPKDATECNVLIKNKTDKPLSVKLPDAFAGVPVLAQAGAGNVGGGGGNNSSINQGFGGGMGMGGMGMGGMGMGGGMGGGGFFNVAPEKVGQFKVPIVCLEHGKRDPRPAVPYEIKPLDSFTTKAGVREVLQALGTGAVNQRVAQVAAWHLNNGMSFQELASKVLRFADGSSRPYFSPDELKAGMQAVALAEKVAKERAEQTGKSGSLSQK